MLQVARIDAAGVGIAQAFMDLRRVAQLHALASRGCDHDAREIGDDGAFVTEDAAYKMNSNPNIHAGETWREMHVTGYGPPPKTAAQLAAEAAAEKQRLTALAARLAVPEKERVRFIAHCEKARAEWLRASELESPAPRGHFLRTLGQSDREFVENANANASIPQALLLMNGDLLSEKGLLSPHSLLTQFIARAKTSADQTEPALARHPLAPPDARGAHRGGQRRGRQREGNPWASSTRCSTRSSSSSSNRRMLKTALSLLAVALLLPPLRAAENADAAALRRVADHVLAQTTRRLIDRGTGETFIDSAALTPKPEISIESKFNAWFYQTWLLADGVRRTAAALDEPRYRDYGEQNLGFIFRHMDYFQRQHAAKMNAAPVGDGVLSPIGFYFQIDSLWQIGLAPLVLERHAATQDARCEPFLARVRKFLATNARFDDGLLYREGKGAMTDDPYMTVPFLVRERRFDEAVAQVLGTHARLFDRQAGLLRHLWDVETQAPAGVFWGRGNGWMVLAQVELLSTLPDSHPRRAEVLAAFREHMAGLRRHQHAEGGWHQVLDHPESWIETSCTGMITYGLARGVNEGWLDATFADSARGGWRALQTKLTPDGDLVDVCGSTDTGDLAFYLKRPRLQGDLHGFGSYLLAGAEIVRAGRKSRP